MHLRAFFIVILVSYLQLHALSNSAKLDMLKIKLTKQLKSKQYQKALSTMQELKSLNVSLPKSFAYFEGKALYETGSHAASYKKMEQYVNDNGSRGNYYKQALKYMMKAEKEKQKVEGARDVVKEFIGLNQVVVSEDYTEKAAILKLQISDCSIQTTTRIQNSGFDGQYTSEIYFPRVEVVKFRREEDDVPFIFFYDRPVNVFTDNRMVYQHNEKSYSEKEKLRDAFMILKQNAINSGCK